MTTQPIGDDEPGARVYQLRPGRGSTAGVEVIEPREQLDTHYEIALDDEPEPTAARGPVYVDVVSRDDTRRPIVPAALRGPNLGPTVKRAAGVTGHRTGYHAVRSPKYVVLAVLWACVGVVRLAGRQLRWWWVSEQHDLRQEAATRNDADTWLKLHHAARAARLWRGLVLAGEAVGLAVAVGLLISLAPRWVQLLAVAGAVPYLAHVGRPAGRPILSAAVVTPRFRTLTADIVLRAYYAAGLGHIDKPGQQIMFGGPMARDGEGSRVLVDLPHGRGLDDAIKALPKIASGLDVSLSQVYISRDPTSHRRHVLWVADRDPLAVPAGRTPLLRLRQTDIWEPAPLGLDARGRPVTVLLLWESVLIGALPRQGKSFAARTLALYAALDPYVQLTVFDGKGSPDWRRFALVADRCGFGLVLSRDGDPVDAFVDALREIKADVQDRYQRLSALPSDICPEGKLTREIARDPQYRMPVRMLVIDECQEYFTLGDPSKEIAELLVYLVKVAPAAGVIVVDATQRPSRVGSGHVGEQFTAFRDQHGIRFGLRTSSWQVSDLVLGAGAYSEGLDTSTLLSSYKGVGILRGAAIDDSPTVRTYLADGQDAERILTAARQLRERAGTLSGYAAGETVTRDRRDFLADLRSVFRAGEAHVSWKELAERLAGQMPEFYAEITQAAVSARAIGLGVTTQGGKVPNSGGQVLNGADLYGRGRIVKGVQVVGLVDAIEARQITSGGDA